MESKGWVGGGKSDEEEEEREKRTSKRVGSGYDSDDEVHSCGSEGEAKKKEEGEAKKKEEGEAEREQGEEDEQGEEAKEGKTVLELYSAGKEKERQASLEA
ncbi:hypothetical protein IE53DRAFT_361509 [Violaceomyces palustris]|uniref:Uncharacterized protein n=1 Tax=Violaceomyces palustris TaxID=1673888 RepID=A0ACD0P0C2_9BASI|nr:hypothetical protein IE53DRAFT_361509 [Violaceomyces palustris]